MNGENDDQWIYDIVPEEQVDSIKESFRNIRDNETTQINLVLSAPRSAAIDLCKTFRKSINGDYQASWSVIRFMQNIVEMIEQELEDNGINPYQD
jgi:hypothetical protein